MTDKEIVEHKTRPALDLFAHHFFANHLPASPPAAPAPEGVPSSCLRWSSRFIVARSCLLRDFFLVPSCLFDFPSFRCYHERSRGDKRKNPR
jgi:hypothetical protein